MSRFTARFSPQAWVNDYAIEVDAQGDTEWDVTDDFLALPDDYRAMLLEEIEQQDEALDGHDLLKGGPSAPEWVREWQGPFSLYVRPTRSYTVQVKKTTYGQYEVEADSIEDAWNQAELDNGVNADWSIGEPEFEVIDAFQYKEEVEAT